MAFIIVKLVETDIGIGKVFRQFNFFYNERVKHFGRNLYKIFITNLAIIKKHLQLIEVENSIDTLHPKTVLLMMIRFVFQNRKATVQLFDKK